MNCRGAGAWSVPGDSLTLWAGFRTCCWVSVANAHWITALRGAMRNLRGALPGVLAGQLLALLLGAALVPDAHAEVMLCDSSRDCRLVCYFPSDSDRAGTVYPAAGVVVDRVLVEPIGEGSLLYTSQHLEKMGTLPSHSSLESFVLPRNYPCRLSPIDADTEHTVPDEEHQGTRMPSASSG